MPVAQSRPTLRQNIFQHTLDLTKQRSSDSTVDVRGHQQASKEAVTVTTATTPRLPVTSENDKIIDASPSTDSTVTTSSASLPCIYRNSSDSRASSSFSSSQLDDIWTIQRCNAFDEDSDDEFDDIENRDSIELVISYSQDGEISYSHEGDIFIR